MKKSTVTLQKLQTNAKPIIGNLHALPKRGNPVIIEFSDGVHEYVTTPVVRVFYVIENGAFYVETTNNRYRLTINAKTES